MNLTERGHEAVNWIHLAEDRNMWMAFVNVVKNSRVPQMQVISQLVQELFVSFSRAMIHGHKTSTYALMLKQIRITSKLSFIRVHNIPLPLYETIFGLTNI